MKRHSLIYTALTLILVLTAATSAFAVFPDYKPGLFPRVGDGEVTIPIKQGFCGNNVVWYFCTDTSNVRYATTENLTFAPKLLSALDNGARFMYVVTNFNNSGPVFQTCPNQTSPTYSGLWEVKFVSWNPGFTPHVITNTRPETKNNPKGLPSEASGKVTITNIPNVSPDLDSTETFARIVVDCPIVAVGSLAQPKNNPRFGGIYRIPQILALDSFSAPKTVTLPTFSVFCRDNIHGTIGISRVIIPDVQDPGLARLLGANVAPALRLVPFTDTQRFWVVDWAQTADNGGTLVVPPGQLPVVEECPSNFFWGLDPEPSPFSWQNTNEAYSPIGRFTLLDRFFDPVNFPGFTDKTTIRTPEFIELLESLTVENCTNNLLEVITQNTRINAPQIPGEVEEIPVPPCDGE